MNTPLRSCLVAASCLAALSNLNTVCGQTLVGNAAQLQTAIDDGDASIQLTAPITVTTPIYIGTTSSPTIAINGAGNSITGTSEVFFVQSGNITISNTTLSGTAVGGNGGGDAQETGAGSLGAGGAIFVGATANVTASNVQFSDNSATGGSAPVTVVSGGGFGGGGGMNSGTGGSSTGNGGGGGGGNGGVGGTGVGETGGGGGGLQSAGGAGNGGTTGGNGGGPNGGAGGTSSADGGAGGANSGGGGGASNSDSTNGGHGGTNGGGGGGVEGAAAGSGGDYSGGGGANGNAGNGGFGGGGGGGYLNGGAGGFGGGGGASNLSGGTAGVGGGNGATGDVSQGGGGAGFGGAVFVQQGGSFIITGSGTFTGNSVTAGTGGNPGAAAGSDIFVMTGAATTFAPGTGKTITVNDTIADDSIASLPSGDFYNPGTGAGAALVIGASGSMGGTVALNQDNTYSGGTTIGFGTTLAVGSAGALGSGAVNNVAGTLTVGNGNHAIVAATFSQGANGKLLLNLVGAGTAANADELIVTNGAASGAALGGTLAINFSNFTIPAGSPRSFDFTVVQTDSGYTGTFTALDAIDLPGNAKATVLYTNADDVELQINLLGISVTGLTPNEQAPISAINKALLAGSSSASLTVLTNALTALSGPAAIGRAADELSPIKFGHFASTTAFNNESFETQAEDTYLAGLREGPNGTFLGGSGQLDASQLTVNDPNIDPGLQMIHSRMLAWNTPDTTVSDVPGALLGGVDMKDMKSCQNCAAPDNPWNVFVRGNVILAQGFSQADQPHFDDNSEAVVVGADYRFSPHFLVGLTAGYSHTDATLDTANSSATVDSYSPGIYASYANKGWYANFIGRYSYNSYTEQRNISFLGQSANGATDGNEGMVNLDGGYDFHSGAWTFGPVAGLQYTHLTVNSYSESGSDASLAVDEDESDSLRSRLGGTVKYDFHGCGATFTPHLTASWQHEFMDASRGITSQFSNFSGGSFIVRTQNSGDDSALIDAGLDAKIDKTITVFGDYLMQAGQSDYFGQSVEAGVRVNF